MLSEWNLLNAQQINNESAVKPSNNDIHITLKFKKMHVTSFYV